MFKARTVKPRKFKPRGFNPGKLKGKIRATSTQDSSQIARTLLKTALLLFPLLGFMALLRAQSPDLPPGAAQAKVRTACLECHDASIIIQQRLSKPAWTKEVDKMIKWGALVDPADRDAFIDYLSTNFPPDKPPAEMPKSAKK